MDKFSISVRVDSVNPVHARISIFTGRLPDELPHENGTRGLAGSLTMSTFEFEQFVRQLKPHILFALDADNTFIRDYLKDLREW